MFTCSTLLLFPYPVTGDIHGSVQHVTLRNVPVDVLPRLFLWLSRVKNFECHHIWPPQEVQCVRMYSVAWGALVICTNHYLTETGRAVWGELWGELCGRSGGGELCGGGLGCVESCVGRLCGGAVGGAVWGAGVCGELCEGSCVGGAVWRELCGGSCVGGAVWGSCVGRSVYMVYIRSVTCD